MPTPTPTPDQLAALRIAELEAALAARDVTVARLTADNAALALQNQSLAHQRDHWEQQGWETLLAATAYRVAAMPAGPLRDWLETPLPLGPAAERGRGRGRRAVAGS